MPRSPIVHRHFMLHFYERINDDDDDDYDYRTSDLTINRCTPADVLKVAIREQVKID